MPCFHSCPAADEIIDIVDGPKMLAVEQVGAWVWAWLGVAVPTPVPCCPNATQCIVTLACMGLAPSRGPRHAHRRC